MDLDNIDSLPVFDEENTRNMRTMLGDEFDSIVDEFIDTTPPLIEALQNAIAQSDNDEIVNVAHRLKSGSANLGLTAFSTVCRYLEEGTRAGSPLDFDRAMSLVHEQFAKIKAA